MEKNENTLKVESLLKNKDYLGAIGFVNEVKVINLQKIRLYIMIYKALTEEIVIFLKGDSLKTASLYEVVRQNVLERIIHSLDFSKFTEEDFREVHEEMNELYIDLKAEISNDFKNFKKEILEDVAELLESIGQGIMGFAEEIKPNEE